MGLAATENIVQAIARDILADSLLRAEAAGLNPIGHVHDEIICELPATEADAGYNTLQTIVSTPPAWAPDLPLAAKGGVMDFYQK